MIDELQKALETVEIDLRATMQQRDRALALYDEAARNQDRHGVKAQGERIDHCEGHLKELREKRSSLDEELRRERRRAAADRGDFGEAFNLLTDDEMRAIIQELNFLTDDEKRAFFQKWKDRTSDNSN